MHHFMSWRCPNSSMIWVSVVLSCNQLTHLKWWNSNLYEKNNYFVILYSHVFFIIIQYYDNAFQKFYFLMQFLSICYRIHRSSYLKYGDPAGPRAPKSGGSADPADPVVPTPLFSPLSSHWPCLVELCFYEILQNRGAYTGGEWKQLLPSWVRGGIKSPPNSLKSS